MEKKRGSAIIDFETPSGKRDLTFLMYGTSFEDACNFFKNKFKDYSPRVVQFVSPITGETIKGPKYDTTTQPPAIDKFQRRLEDYLNGVIQQPPKDDPAQYEPRDRIQEKKSMKLNKEYFRSLINECKTELVKENQQSTRQKLKEGLRPLVRKVLLEISSNNNPKPDKKENEKINKGYNKDGNERLSEVNKKLLSELETIVHGINKDWEVCWDDHNQLVINANNMLYVRICPKFENNFDIDAMIKLVDRVRVIAVTWDQVKEFVKANFGNLSDQTNASQAQKNQVDTSLGKKQKEDGKDAGPRHDIPKEKKVSDTKKDNKDYNEKSVSKDEDEPSSPMRDASNKPLNKDIEKTPQVKPPKHKSNDGDDKLRVALSSTKKHRVKKS